MNYGFYVSAGGMLANMYRQDVFANNLANVQTPGFKVDMASVKQRDAESVEDGFGADVSRALLDKIGGGVLAAKQQIDFSRGRFDMTNNPYDLAIEEPKSFFAVNMSDAKTGQPQIHLTRDGRFTRSAEGYLVTMTGGHKVLDSQDQPIVISSDGKFSVNSKGKIIQNGQEIAQLQITGVKDTGKLIKAGQSLFKWLGKADIRTPPASVAVKQGFMETSGVDPIKTLMHLVEATKAANGNANMIRYHDQLLDRAVNVLGRVA